MLRALVVEDEQPLQDLYGRVLASAGLEVSFASDGDVAINLLEHAAPPNLILLDIRMPRCNGYEVLEYLQSYPNIENIFVVIMTATQKFESYCSMLPVTEFLLKPVLPNHLQQVVDYLNRLS